jgi:hypothetical protein
MDISRHFFLALRYMQAMPRDESVQNHCAAVSSRAAVSILKQDDRKARMGMVMHGFAVMTI